MNIQTIHQTFISQQAEAPDLYTFLNHFRNWFNAHIRNYELFLEDNWFEDKTTIEYALRCLDTLNMVVLAEDEYQNSRDNNVWNLGPYVTTYWVVEDPWQVIESFIQENTLPQAKVTC